jgi:pimeloyl-ACP methyl ester carboxylesterase
VKQQLVDLDASAGSATDLPFVVHGTAADPRFLDLTLDPSDREPGTMWGPAAEANYMPASLGHYSSLRSWLSQWSIDDTNANGPAALTRTSVPTIVIYGTADQVCFPSQATSLYEAVPHDDRHLLAVKGGTHYLHGQPELMGEVADMIVNWLADRGMR